MGKVDAKPKYSAAELTGEIHKALKKTTDLEGNVATLKDQIGFLALASFVLIFGLICGWLTSASKNDLYLLNRSKDCLMDRIEAIEKKDRDLRAGICMDACAKVTIPEGTTSTFTELHGVQCQCFGVQPRPPQPW